MRIEVKVFIDSHYADCLKQRKSFISFSFASDCLRGQHIIPGPTKDYRGAAPKEHFG